MLCVYVKQGWDCLHVERDHTPLKYIWKTVLIHGYKYINVVLDDVALNEICNSLIQEHLEKSRVSD